MLQEEPDEEDEEAICPGSESETCDDDDQDFLPECEAGVVGVSGESALLHSSEDSSDDAEKLFDQSSEQETQIQYKWFLLEWETPHSWQNKKL